MMFYLNFEKELISDYYVEYYNALLTDRKIISAVKSTWQNESLILQVTTTVAAKEAENFKKRIYETLEKRFSLTETPNRENNITLLYALTLTADALQISQEKIKYINQRASHIKNRSSKITLTTSDLNKISEQIKKESGGKTILENAIREGRLNSGIIRYASDRGFIYEEEINNELTPSWFIGEKVINLQSKKELLQFAAEENQPPMILNGTESEFINAFATLAQENKLQSTLESIIKKIDYKNDLALMQSLERIISYLLQYHVTNMNFSDAAKLLHLIHQNDYTLNIKIPPQLIEACVGLQPKPSVEFIIYCKKMLTNHEALLTKTLKEKGYSNQEILAIEPNDILDFFSNEEMRTILNKIPFDKEKINLIRNALKQYQATLFIFPNQNSTILAEKLSLFMDRIDLKINYNKEAATRTLSNVEIFELYCLLSAYINDKKNKEEYLYEQLKAGYTALQDEFLGLSITVQNLYRAHQTKDKALASANLIKEKALQCLKGNSGLIFGLDSRSANAAREMITEQNPNKILNQYELFLKQNNSDNKLAKELSSIKNIDVDESVDTTASPLNQNSVASRF